MLKRLEKILLNTVERNSSECKTSIRVEQHEFDSSSPKKNATPHEINKECTLITKNIFSKNEKCIFLSAMIFMVEKFGKDDKRTDSLYLSAMNFMVQKNEQKITKFSEICLRINQCKLTENGNNYSILEGIKCCIGKHTLFSLKCQIMTFKWHRKLSGKTSKYARVVGMIDRNNR